MRAAALAASSRPGAGLPFTVREDFPPPPGAAPRGPVREAAGSPAGPPRLLDRVRAAIRARHYSPRTEAAYVGWIRRFILFHGKRHPLELSEAEVTGFLTSLATGGRVAASTQNQAFSALLFLYREVLKRELAWLDGVVRAKRPVRLPVVLAREEVAALMRQLRGVERIMASLLYGAGLRPLGCCRLRVKDVDFDRREITVRDGKGGKDRVTLLPERLTAPLAARLERVCRRHEEDLRVGTGSVELPAALERKRPRAPGSGAGSGCFRPRGTMWTHRADAGAGTTCTSRCSSGP